MKLDNDLFSTNMNTIEFDGKKVMVQPSQAVVTKGKEVVIGEERHQRMIRSKNLEIGRWKKNERSKPRSRSNVTFYILMTKYRDGKTDIRGRENRSIRFFWIRPVLLRQEDHSAINPGH
jgi:RNA recognition motif-containing protein